MPGLIFFCVVLGIKPRALHLLVNVLPLCLVTRSPPLLIKRYLTLLLLCAHVIGMCVSVCARPQRVCGRQRTKFSTWFSLSVVSSGDQTQLSRIVLEVLLFLNHLTAPSCH